MNKRIRFKWMMAVVGIWFLGISGAWANEVLHWNGVAIDAVTTTLTRPPQASRVYAMVHAAVYDSVNSIVRDHEPYVVQQDPQGSASPDAAVIGASHAVLSALYPGLRAKLDLIREARLAQLPEGEPKVNGLRLGEQVAAAFLAHRQGDIPDRDVISSRRLAPPGIWVPTPPDFLPFLAPNWGKVKPFAMYDVADFRPPAPPALNSDEYAIAYNEVQRLGAKESGSRTEDQTEIAFFWLYDDAGKATPAGHWNKIVQGIAHEYGTDIYESARLFALLNIAMADAAILAWDAKDVYYNWRPITAIRRGDEDGNDDTDPDSRWEPLLNTPPFPDYISGHSTFGAATAAVVGGFFGTDNIPFTALPDELPGVTRSFSTLTAAAEENGRSRIYGGVHFEFANRQGLASGKELGRYVVENVATPLDGGGEPCPGCR